MQLVFSQEGRRLMTLFALIARQLYLAVILFLGFYVAGIVRKIVVFATLLIHKHFKIADSPLFWVFDLLKKEMVSLSPSRYGHTYNSLEIFQQLLLVSLNHISECYCGYI